MGIVIAERNSCPHVQAIIQKAFPLWAVFDKTSSVPKKNRLITLFSWQAYECHTRIEQALTFGSQWACA
jgi:hypothetical protein